MADEEKKEQESQGDKTPDHVESPAGEVVSDSHSPLTTHHSLLATHHTVDAAGPASTPHRLTSSPPKVFSDEDLALIREEERIFEQVRSALHLADASRPAMGNLLGRMRELRDEASHASESDLPALFDQLHTHQALAGRTSRPGLPDARSPYFARMRLRVDGRSRDILLGHRTYIDPERCVTIIDWRHAPISRIFYTYREGEAYEEEFPGGLSRGVVELRRVLTVRDGRLVRISAAGRCFVREDGASWTSGEPDHVPLLAGGQGAAMRPPPIGEPRGAGRVARHEPEVSALLDREQFELLDAEDETPLLILGGAGSGKTTVALHRLAALAYRDPGRYKPRQMMVVAPERGLVRLSRKLLDGLGMDGVRVTTFDDWVRTQARMLLRGLPRRLCESTPARVIRFKRHPALIAALPEFLEKQARDITARLRRLPRVHAGEIAGRFEQAKHDTLLARLEHAEKPFVSKRFNPILDRDQAMEHRAVTEALEEEKARMFDLTNDRIELFSDREILGLAVQRSGGDLTPGMAEDVLEHSRMQFAAPAEEQYSDVDSGRLIALDNRPLDEGTPQEIAGSIDVEDFAVLLELLRRKTGKIKTPWGRMHTYAHLAVDEAQDLAPVELSILGQALRKSSSITIAGDAAQQIDPAVAFKTWERALDHLGVRRADAAHLKTTYRSPRPIALFAHALLGPLAPAEAPRAVREGLPVERSVFPSDGHAALFLTEALAALAEREPRASVAIIARNANGAKAWHSALAPRAHAGPRARLVLDGEFEFKPGVDVTYVQQTKGLEFDYVVIPDADAQTYPDTPENRRLLHVAATRAIHQLWVISVDKPSPILPKEIRP